MIFRGSVSDLQVYIAKVWISMLYVNRWNLNLVSKTFCNFASHCSHFSVEMSDVLKIVFFWFGCTFVANILNSSTFSQPIIKNAICLLCRHSSKHKKHGGSSNHKDSHKSSSKSSDKHRCVLMSALSLILVVLNFITFLMQAQWWFLDSRCSQTS